MTVIADEIERMIAIIAQQNAALRGGELSDLSRTTGALTRLTEQVETRLKAANGPLPRSTRPAAERLRSALDENARLIRAAQSGASAARRGAFLGYDANGRFVNEDRRGSLTLRSPKQL